MKAIDFRMRRMPALITTVIILVLCMSSTLPAETTDSATTVDKAEIESLPDAIRNGELAVSVRLRYEGVDQDDIAKKAEAATGRLRLGYQTAPFHNWFAYLEVEAITDIGDDRYNSTANGRDDFPAVLDPEDAEFNQGFLAWQGPRDTLVKLGRQRIKLNNDRIIGNVGFRQNEQTYDAFSFSSALAENVKVTGGYIDRANRIFGEHNPDPARANTDLSAIFLNVDWDSPVGTLTGYFTGIEFDDLAQAAGSHQNLGIRFKGGREMSERFKLLYTAEFVDQTDYADAPSTVDADYLLGELGLQTNVVTVKLGYELLGGDGVYGFSTPLATLHAFNGWTDKFVSTPATGIEDLYLLATGKIKGWKLLGVYHDFSADQGSSDYGSEFGFLVARKFAKGLYGTSFKYARFDADSAPYVDTDKFWLTLDINFKR